MTTVEESPGARPSPKASQRKVVSASHDQPRIGLEAGSETPQPMISASNTVVRISSLPSLLIGIRKTSRRGRKRDEAAEHRGLARFCFPVDAKCHLSVPAGCDVDVARGQ